MIDMLGLSSLFPFFLGRQQNEKAFTFVMEQYFGVMLLDVKLFVDDEEIDLNEFVVKILSGTIDGAVTSLRGIKKNWKEIKITVVR